MNQSVSTYNSTLIREGRRENIWTTIFTYIGLVSKTVCVPINFETHCTTTLLTEPDRIIKQCAAGSLLLDIFLMNGTLLVKLTVALSLTTSKMNWITS